MSIIGIVNAVIFVMLLVKFGIKKALGYVIGNFFIGLIVGIVITVVCVLVLHMSSSLATVIIAIAQFITALIRIKGAMNELR